MKKYTIKAVMAIIMAVMAIALTGCTSCSSCNTRAAELDEHSSWELVHDTRTEEHEWEVTLPEETAIYVDVSWSVESPKGETAEAKRLRGKLEALQKDFPNAVLRQFAEKTEGNLNPLLTDIVEVLRDARDKGYRKVFILTDGHQDNPDVGWSGLENVDFSNLDVCIFCLEKTEYTDDLCAAFSSAKAAFQSSSVKIEFLDGEKPEVLYSGYAMPKGKVIVQDKDTWFTLEESCQDSAITAVDNDIADRTVSKDNGWWWKILLFILGLLLLAALAWLLWNWIKDSLNRPKNKPVPNSQPASTTTKGNGTMPTSSAGTQQVSNPGAVSQTAPTSPATAQPGSNPGATPQSVPTVSATAQPTTTTTAQVPTGTPTSACGCELATLMLAIAKNGGKIVVRRPRRPR